MYFSMWPDLYIGAESTEYDNDLHSLTLGVHAQEGYGTCPVCLSASHRNLLILVTFTMCYTW